MDGSQDRTQARRPGGRSARVRAAVLRATLDELVERGVSGLSIAAIAARADVHPTSIYRRWKTAEALALDAALDAAKSNVPIPDRGALRADLLQFLMNLDAHVRSPVGKALLALSGLDRSAADDIREAFWDERFARARVMFARAVERKEIDPDTDTKLALEMAIAPVYLRALVLNAPANEELLARQVDVLLAAIGRLPANR